MKEKLCRLKKSHYPHDWGIFKKLCLGKNWEDVESITIYRPSQGPWDVESKIFQHRHFFKIDRFLGWIGGNYVYWTCACGAKAEKYKPLFYGELTGEFIRWPQ